MPRQKLPKLCNNIRCRTTVSPLWRKGWDREDGTNARLCNACGLHWRKGHFCPYPWCMAIYKEHETEHFGDDWIRCAGCSRWSHSDCVLRACDDNVNDSAGEDEEDEQLKAKKRQQLLQRPHYCPDCDPIKTHTTTTTITPITHKKKKSTGSKKAAAPAKPKSSPTKKATSPTKRKREEIDSFDSDDDYEEEEEEEFTPVVPKKRRSSITSIHLRGSARMKAKVGRRRDSFIVFDDFVTNDESEDEEAEYSPSSTTTTTTQTQTVHQTTTVQFLSSVEIDTHFAKQLIQQKFHTADECSGLSSLWAVCEIELRNLSKV